METYNNLKGSNRMARDSEKHKEVLRRQRKGRAAEEMARNQLILRNWHLERDPYGQDWIGTRYNMLTGEVEKKRFESKTPGSSLTRLQRQTRRESGDDYVIIENEPIPAFYEDPFEDSEILRDILDI